MSQEKKTSKRKILIRYLILAACILVIAAVTVTCVFAANDWFRSDITIDSGNNTPDDDKNNGGEPSTPVEPSTPDDGNDEPDKPSSAETKPLAPLSNLNVIKSFDFLVDVSLMNSWHFHEGLDMAADAGTAVVACLDGTVESIVLDDELDGNQITVKHADGTKTVYTYVNVKDGLKEGAEVKRGDTLGTVAEPTGAEYMQEAHLHFEVIDASGETIDPAEYLELADK